jgi:hypothetical protein
MFAALVYQGVSGNTIVKYYGIKGTIEVDIQEREGGVRGRE